MAAKVSAAQAAQAIGRPVFTSREIAALRGSSMSATGRALRRMERQGLLLAVRRGIWCMPNSPRFTPFALVPYLAGSHQAYISFLSALHLHGLIEQIPRVIYAATTGHTRVVRTPIGTFSFHRIHPRFFAGFEWYQGGQEFLIAEPEKALVDSLYVSSRKGRQFAHFPEMNLSGRFLFRRAKEWVDRIPDERIRKHVDQRLRELRKRSPVGR